MINKYDNLRKDVKNMNIGNSIEIPCLYHEMNRIRSSIKFFKFGCITRYRNECLYIFKVLE